MPDSVPHRLLPRLAASGRIAASLGKAAARRLVRRSEDDDRALGDALLGELDRLKGLAMKVGQILSYMEVGLPEATVERLAMLQKGTSPLDFDAVRAALEASLGSPLDALFDELDPVPVASASIGQVHRATLRGVPVAVKVRHPLVRETLDADLRQVGPLARLSGLASAVDGEALVRELHARMLEECDYAREAAWQAAFAAAFADDPDIVVPAVFPDRSSNDVLTTAWQDGRPLLDGPLSERVARAMVRFPFTAIFAHGALQADPHPGNFLIDGERLITLDFGCVRAFDATTVETWRSFTLAILDGRRGDFADLAIAAGLAPDPDRFDFDDLWAMQRWQHRPYLASHFRFEPSWWEDGLRWTRPDAPNARRMGIPPAEIWRLRMTWGLHAILMRGGAEGRFDDLLRAALARPLNPIPTP